MNVLPYVGECICCSTCVQLGLSCKWHKLQHFLTSDFLRNCGILDASSLKPGLQRALAAVWACLDSDFGHQPELESLDNTCCHEEGGYVSMCGLNHEQLYATNYFFASQALQKVGSRITPTRLVVGLIEKTQEK